MGTHTSTSSKEAGVGVREILRRKIPNLHGATIKYTLELEHGVF